MIKYHLTFFFFSSNIFKTRIICHPSFSSNVFCEGLHLSFLWENSCQFSKLNKNNFYYSIHILIHILVPNIHVFHLACGIDATCHYNTPTFSTLTVIESLIEIFILLNSWIMDMTSFIASDKAIHLTSELGYVILLFTFDCQESSILKIWSISSADRISSTLDIAKHMHSQDSLVFPNGSNFKLKLFWIKHILDHVKQFMAHCWVCNIVYFWQISSHISHIDYQVFYEVKYHHNSRLKYFLE